MVRLFDPMVRNRLRWYPTDGIYPYYPILSFVLSSASSPNVLGPGLFPHLVPIGLGYRYRWLVCREDCFTLLLHVLPPPFPPHRLSVGCPLHVHFCQYTVSTAYLVILHACTKYATSQRLTSSCLSIHVKERDCICFVHGKRRTRLGIVYMRD